MIARVMTIALAVVLAGGCAPDEPRFGAPGAIAKQSFAGEEPVAGVGGDASTGAFAPFPKPYDADDPPRPARTGAEIHAGKASIDPTTDCGGCHGAQPVAGAPSFSFAGLAFAAPASEAPLEFGEVVVLTRAGVFATVKTASDGFFALSLDRGPVPPEATVAVRDASGKISKMTSAATGACNAQGCHGGAAGRIDFAR